MKNTDTKNTDTSEDTYEFTDELHDIISGHPPEENAREEEINKYLSIVGSDKNVTDLKYIKHLTTLLNKIKTTGEGLIKFLTNNPVMLFIELRKLLAAKKAGHTNVYNEVNAILKQLLVSECITPKWYGKI